MGILLLWNQETQQTLSIFLPILEQIYLNPTHGLVNKKNRLYMIIRCAYKMMQDIKYLL